MTAMPLRSGFRDPVRDSQAVFRAVMNAMARPGSIQALAGDLDAPTPLMAELATVILTLADHETSLWLDPVLAGSEAVTSFLRFHTGARQVGDPSTATFALVSNSHAMLPLTAFAEGTDEYPDRSTTIIMAVDRIGAGARLLLDGPGIKDEAVLALDPLPANFVVAWADNRARFPRGVDCVFVASGAMVGLPRSTRVREG
jgi:alpha-D-ribose 1-methylphosphonate 5-triphosphate synthase subunit PhnH